MCPSQCDGSSRGKEASCFKGGTARRQRLPLGVHPAVLMGTLALATNYASRCILPVGAGALAAMLADEDSHSNGRRIEAVGLVSMCCTAFFIGDLTAQLAAGAVLRRLSGARLISMSSIGLGLCVLATPLALRGTSMSLVTLQVLFGACCGFGYPAAHALLGEMVSEKQRSTSLSFINSAASMGQMLGNSVTPVLIQLMSWPTPFIAAATCSLCVGGSVVSHFRDQEKELARTKAAKAEAKAEPPEATTTAVVEAGSVREELRTWMGDPFIQAMLLYYYVLGVAYHGVNSFIPTLLGEVFGAEGATLGGLTAIPPMAQVVSCFVGGIVADKLMASGRFRQHHVRTAIQTLAIAGPLVAVIALMCAKHIASGIAAVTLWMATGSLHCAGVTACIHDVAKKRAGELFAVNNVACKFAAILAPSWIRVVRAYWGWSGVLSVVVAHYIVGGVVLLPRMSSCVETAKLFNTHAEAQKKVS